MKITENEKKMFDYLNQLRTSGVTNMFGAGPYLVKEFGIHRHESIRILSKWMENFNKDGYENLV